MGNLKNVEIRGDFGEKYPAEILSIDHDYAHIVYIETPNQTHKVPIEFVYYAPYQSEISQNLPELISGTLVDVLIINNTLPFVYDNEEVISKAWWPAIVKKCQGDYVVVDLLDLQSGESVDLSENNQQILRKEIVDLDCTRLRCESISFVQRPLKSLCLDIPEYYRNCFIDFKYEEDFRKWSGEPVTFIKSNDNMTVTILSNEESVIYRAKLISKLWIHQWPEKYRLVQQLEDFRNYKEDVFQTEFTVDRELLDYALGNNYSNLKQINQMPDVISAHLSDSSGKFTITAKTEAGVVSARAKLELDQLLIEYERSLINILLARPLSNPDDDSPNLLTQIVEHTDLVQLIVIGDDYQEASKLPAKVLPANSSVFIKLIGTKSALKDARTILEFSREHLTTMLDVCSNNWMDLDKELLNDMKICQQYKSIDPNRNQGHRIGTEINTTTTTTTSAKLSNIHQWKSTEN